MIITAIDPATKQAGWARLDTATGALLGSGTDKLKNLNTDLRCRDFGEMWFERFKQAKTDSPWRTDVVVYEAQFAHGHASDGWMMIAAYEIRLALVDAELPYAEVAVGTLKKAAAGSGRASKPEVRKAMEQRFARRFRSDDEADAVALAYTAAVVPKILEGILRAPSTSATPEAAAEQLELGVAP